MNNVTNTSQITGHVQGSTVFSIARTKVSQKVKQRVASRMQGICNLCSSASFQWVEKCRDSPQSIFGDRDVFGHRTLNDLSAMSKETMRDPYRK